MATNGIFVSIKMIQKLVNTYLSENGVLYFLFDNASSGEVWRKNLNPDYKMNRRRQEPGFYRGLDFLQILLIHYEDNWRVIQYPTYEADDLVEPVITGIPRDKKIGIVSNDLDWARAISENVVWIRAGRRNGEYIYDEINGNIFNSLYGFVPCLKNICIYKSLRGDRIDNIGPGVERISKKNVLAILNQVESVEDIFNNVGSLNVPNHVKHTIINNREKILLNYSLVDYRPITVKSCQSVTVVSRFNPKVLKMLYSTLNFNLEKIDMRLAKYFKHEKKYITDDFEFAFSEYGRA
jgi:5'-3' exonuclease